MTALAPIARPHREPSLFEQEPTMAQSATAELLPPEQPGTDIVVAVTKDPGIVLLDRQKFDAWYDKLKAEAPAAGDMSVKKDRDTLRSFAARVRGEKAAIDKARLRLTEQWRTMTAQANAAGKEIKDRLETLEEEVRAPLTAWEDAEEARINECRAVIERLKAAAVVTMEDTAATVRERGAEVWNTELDPERFGDMLTDANGAKLHAVSTLKAALARLTQEEADRAELERLRAEAAERERIEAEKRAEEERKAREAEEARIAEERRVAAEKAEAERLARVEREAAERAQREAEQAAEAERQRIQREHEEALAAERRRAAEAERAAQAERDRIAQEEAARAAEAKRLADEQAAREADQAHRSAVMKAAKEAIMTCGVDEDTAKKIVLLIRSGEVPNVSLRF